jgi:four helix bundle protein
MNIRTFEDLEVWKKGREVRLFVQNVIKKFPSDEKFALVFQIRKSSRSITKILQKDMGDTFTKKILSFVEYQGVLLLKLWIT